VNWTYKTAAGIVLGGLLTWGVFVTQGVYTQEVRVCRAGEDIVTLEEKVSEEQKTRQSEMREMSREQKKDNQKIMELLLDIQKQVRN
jgi:hypothetical protein